MPPIKSGDVRKMAAYIVLDYNLLVSSADIIRRKVRALACERTVSRLQPK